MIKYQRNNILFRIASADALSKFKSGQAASFVQLTRKELNFNEAAKEAVLVEYDRFSHWLMRIERICLVAGEGYLHHGLQTAISQSFIEELNNVETVMENNRDVFTQDVINFTKLIHEYTVDMISKQIQMMAASDMHTAFTCIVSAVSNYLQHFLAAFHEFNNNLNTKTQDPFISVAAFCTSAVEETAKFEPALRRAEFFFNSGCGKTFVLKNYSHLDIFRDAHDFFLTRGLEIVRELDIEENLVNH